MFDLPPQIFINGIIAGSLYASIALGLALTYGILKFINLAHAEMATLGGYVFFGLALAGIPVWINVVLTSVLIGISGIIIQKLTFKPIKKAGSYTPMLASIGVGIFLQAAVTLFAGTDIKTLDRGFLESYSFWNEKIFITNLQIAIILISTLLMLGLFVFLKYTKTGKAIRAVADNKEAAEIVGINSEKITTIIFFIASGITAIAGILIGYQNNLHPAMGLPLIIKSFTAVIIGGIGNIPAAIAGGYIIGIAENLAIGITISGFSVPAGYKDAVAFILLIIFLLIRPQGIFVKKQELTKL